LSIVEILLFLVVALIVIPPDRLPEMMQALGKILRELRLASNTVVRELTGAVEDPPYMHERADSADARSEQPPAEPPPQT
jgi:Sec-independent protein translocase protein TatA